jgi:hypothetical protein
VAGFQLSTEGQRPQDDEQNDVKAEMQRFIKARNIRNN